MAVGAPAAAGAAVASNPTTSKSGAPPDDGDALAPGPIGMETPGIAGARKSGAGASMPGVGIGDDGIGDVGIAVPGIGAAGIGVAGIGDEGIAVDGPPEAPGATSLAYSASPSAVVTADCRSKGSDAIIVEASELDAVERSQRVVREDGEREVETHEVVRDA
jgi:hypothetical protein